MMYSEESLNLAHSSMVLPFLASAVQLVDRLILHPIHPLPHFAIPNWSQSSQHQYLEGLFLHGSWLVFKVPLWGQFSQKPGKLHSGTYTIENSLFQTWPLTLFYCILWSLMTHRYSTFLILSWFSCQTLLINWYFFHSKSLAQFHL